MPVTSHPKEHTMDDLYDDWSMPKRPAARWFRFLRWLGLR